MQDSDSVGEYEKAEFDPGNRTGEGAVRVFWNESGLFDDGKRLDRRRGGPEIARSQSRFLLLLNFEVYYESYCIYSQITII